MERITATFIMEFKREKIPFVELTERLKKSIALLESNFVAILLNHKQSIIIIRSFGANRNKEIFITGLRTSQMFCPRNTNELLALGVPPADIFRGSSLHKGVISKEYTAYDIKLKKFIPTDL